MRNIKLMHELLNELKTILVHRDTSLAHALTQLRIQINDVEKIMFNHDQSDAEVIKNRDKLESVCSKINIFKYQYNALCEQLENLMRTINAVSYNHKIFENHSLAINSEEVVCNDSMIYLEKKKAEEMAKKREKELEEAIQKAKNDLKTPGVIEHE